MSLSLRSLPWTDPLLDRNLGQTGRYRNEWKYLISEAEATLLRQRLSVYLEPDGNARNGQYMIRSLYFDDMWNSAYHEKMMGVENRQKWRIRIYNCSDGSIKLERKKKRGSYIHKESAAITREEFEKILANDYSFLLRSPKNLCREFYFECTSRLLRPKVIVDYDREPWIRREGDVRITFDRDVRAAVGSWDIFDPMLPTLRAIEPDMLVLEVKFTEFLPRGIRRILPVDGQDFTALSKYAACYDRAWHLTDPRSSVWKSEKEDIR